MGKNDSPFWCFAIALCAENNPVRKCNPAGQSASAERRLVRTGEARRDAQPRPSEKLAHASRFLPRCAGFGMTGFSLQKGTGRRSWATEVSDTFPMPGTRPEKSFRRPEPRLRPPPPRLRDTSAKNVTPSRSQRSQRRIPDPQLCALCGENSPLPPAPLRRGRSGRGS